VRGTSRFLSVVTFEAIEGFDNGTFLTEGGSSVKIYGHNRKPISYMPHNFLFKIPGVTSMNWDVIRRSRLKYPFNSGIRNLYVY